MSKKLIYEGVKPPKSSRPDTEHWVPADGGKGVVIVREWVPRDRVLNAEKLDIEIVALENRLRELRELKESIQ